MKSINMKHWLYLMMTAVVMSLAACSSDDDDNDGNGLTNPDNGKNNTTDMAVTGGVGKQHLWVDQDGHGYISVDSITGYLNLTDEMKLAMGSVMEYGIELSDSPDHLSSSSYKAYKMVNDRMFIIDDVSYLSEKTKYYYRTYLSTGGYGSVRVYGKTESFTTDSKDNLIKEFKLWEPGIDVGENSAFCSYPGKLAYDTDKTKLTAQNILNGNVLAVISESNELTNLESGTTYYCCSFVTIDEKYTVLSDIVEFTTEGYNVKELARNVSATVSYNETAYVWTVNITSQLGGKYPGHDIKYGIFANLMSDDQLLSTAEQIEKQSIEVAEWSEGTGGIVYATGSGSKYNATVSSPEYYGMVLMEVSESGTYRKLEQLDPSDMEMFLDYEHELLGLIAASEEYGSLTDGEKWRYDDLLGGMQGCYGYYEHAHSLLDVFVEIDGSRYVVKQQEGKLRLPWFLAGTTPDTKWPKEPEEDLDKEY